MGSSICLTRLSGIILNMILRVWAYSGLVLVFCFLLYYFYGGTLAILMLGFALTGILYQIQDNILYSPELPSHSRVYIPLPSTFGLPYQSIHIKSLDGTKIHLYFIPQPHDKQLNAPTIIFFHGNAGNMGHRLQNCVGLYQHLHCNILLVEYRGYGLSEGSPTEEGLYCDARASLEYLHNRNDINHSEIVIFGRSLGGAVAIDLAVRDDCRNKIWCVIVENTFTCIPDMAKVILGWRILKYFPLFFYKNKFMSYQKVKSLRTPTLFISGSADALVPPKMMYDLHNRCSSIRKQLLQIPGGTHNETWQLQGYYHAISQFLQNCRTSTVIQSNFNSEFTQLRNEQFHDANCIWNNVQNI